MLTTLWKSGEADFAVEREGFDRRPKPSRTIARCRTWRLMQGGLESRMQCAICSIRCLARTRGSTTNQTSLLPSRCGWW